MRARLVRSVLLLAAVAACGDSTGPSGDPNTVTVADNSFSPSAKTVTVGTTVNWTWTGSNQHNVTWAAGSPASSTTQSSGAYERTFDAAGTYQYYCSIHGSPTSGMRGTVTVQ